MKTNEFKERKLTKIEIPEYYGRIEKVHAGWDHTFIINDNN